MAFNLTEITNKEIKENGFENPQGTSRGQSVVSVNESWQARSSRLGRVLSVSTSSTGIAMTQGVEGIVIKAVITNGFIGIPMRISVGANGNGVAFIQFQRRASGTTETYRVRIAANTPWEWVLNGEIVAGETTNLTLGFMADNANTNAIGSIIYKEELVQWD